MGCELGRLVLFRVLAQVLTDLLLLLLAQKRRRARPPAAGGEGGAQTMRSSPRSVASTATGTGKPPTFAQAPRSAEDPEDSGEATSSVVHRNVVSMLCIASYIILLITKILAVFCPQRMPDNLRCHFSVRTKSRAYSKSCKNWTSQFLYSVNWQISSNTK